MPEFARPPPSVAELPLIVQSVSATVPEFATPPPSVSEPPLIVRPESDAVTPGSTWNTPTAPPPLIVTSPAPGPSITSAPAVSERISVPVSVIVFAVAKTVGSNSISLPLVPVLALALARKVTYGNVPDVPEPENPPLVELTV